MEDEELLDLVRDSSTLVESAQAALRREVDKRGLKPEPLPADTAEDPDSAFYCPVCERAVTDPLTCGECSATICRLCGSPLRMHTELDTVSDEEEEGTKQNPGPGYSDMSRASGCITRPESGCGMKREEFRKVVSEVMDSLPREFRRRVRNVAVLVEDRPPDEEPTAPGKPKLLRLGLFHGIPMTQKSVFHLPTGPDYVVLYQKNIEAICHNEAELREQIRRTVIHEFGHYFGMTEEQLKDV